MLWLKPMHVVIMSRAWAERHDSATPTAFKGAREETQASRHANGAGPVDPRGVPRFRLARLKETRG